VNGKINSVLVAVFAFMAMSLATQTVCGSYNDVVVNLANDKFRKKVK